MTSAGGTTIAIVIAMVGRFEWRAGFDEEAYRLANPLLASPLLATSPLGSSSVELTVFALVITVF